MFQPPPVWDDDTLEAQRRKAIEIFVTERNNETGTRGDRRSRARPPQERDIAVRWTAGLQTVQEYQTGRRTESSARQEATVADLLTREGFVKVAARPITVVGGFSRGEFSPEARVQGSEGPIKCDIPVGLGDGRLLFIECKVSNSGTNSVKRLNREVGGKAGAWRRAFGERALTAAVLAGVYKLQNLRDAQASGITIFWEHDLAPLVGFLHADV